MPGRSISCAIWSPTIKRAESNETVSPGQLPTLAWAPVSRLSKVDLPVLGIPIKAIVFIFLSAF